MKSRKAFTLVELVIVVLILGILAAVAVPRLFNTSANATDNGLKQSLSTIRDAIELYAADNAKKPGVDGDFITEMEEYIRGPFPKCPVGDATDPDDVLVSTGTGALVGAAVPAEGWAYNSTTGEFIVNFNGASATDATITYDKF